MDSIIESFANIKQGEKYYVNTMSSCVPNTFSFLYRKYNNENREVTIKFIDKVLSEYVIEFNSEKINLCKRAIKGIENLIQTYNNDKSVVVRLTSILNKFKYRLDLVIDSQLQHSNLEVSEKMHILDDQIKDDINRIDEELTLLVDELFVDVEHKIEQHKGVNGSVSNVNDNLMMKKSLKMLSNSIVSH